MTDIDELRMLALALLIAEVRPLAALDDEVRVALAMKARRGRFRCDDLQVRLVQLVGSSDVWRARAEKARKRISGPALTWAPGVGCKMPVGPATDAGRRRA